VAAEINEGSGLAVRLGGEDFLVVLAGTDMSEAVRFAERLRRRIQACAIPHEALGPDSVVTVSVGAAAGPVSAHSFAELVSAADAALYAAKRNGRNQVWPPFVNRGNPVVSLVDENGGYPIAAARGRRRMRSIS
jgi:diguanylate cyclase (GGDEF)-like protein